MWCGSARYGMARDGAVRQAWRGKAWRGEVLPGTARYGMAGKVRRRVVRLGVVEVRRGWARSCKDETLSYDGSVFVLVAFSTFH